MSYITTCKKNNGITGVDLTVSVIIIMLFVSLITTLFYNVYMTTTSNKRATTANLYVVQIFEGIDKLKYEDVIEDSKVSGEDTFITKLTSMINDEILQIKRGTANNYEKGYLAQVQVQNYKEKEGNSEKEDLVKIISIDISYKVGNKINKISSKRLKTVNKKVTDSLRNFSKVI